MPTGTETPTLAELHERVCRGDEEAFAALAKVCVPQLVKHLRGTLHAGERNGLIWDCLEDSAADALLDYRSRPRRFDPSRGVSLLRYLEVLANGKLRNKLRKEQRHQRKEAAAGDEKILEKIAQSAQTSRSRRQLHIEGQEDEWLATCREVLCAVVALLGRQEKAEVDLILAGRKSTAEWASFMGIGELPPQEQEGVVANEKVRIKRKVFHLVRTEMNMVR